MDNTQSTMTLDLMAFMEEHDFVPKELGQPTELFDRDFVRVAIDSDEVEVIGFTGRPGWSLVVFSAKFTPDTPIEIVRNAVAGAIEWSDRQ